MLSSARIDECAVVVGIPLDIGQWLRDLRPGSKKEYAHFYLQNAGAKVEAGEEIWTKLYEPFEARPIRKALADIERMGAEVVIEGDIEDLRSISKRRQVIVVVAHLRSGLLYPEHLLDPDQFIRTLVRSPMPFLSCIRSGLPAPLLTQLAESRERVSASLLEEIIAHLNRLMRTRLLPEDAAPNPAAFELARNREALNAECENILDATHGLELAKGTFTEAEVARSISDGFSGVLDLTACFSVVLAEHIKRSVPCCLVLGNRNAISPSVHLPLIRETLRVLARKPGDYVELSLAIREQLLNWRQM